MKYACFLLFFLSPFTAICGDTSTHSFVGEWYSGRPHWADYVNIRPDGTAIGNFPVVSWNRSRLIQGTWTRVNDSSVTFKWNMPFGPIEAQLNMEKGKSQLLLIEKYEDGHTTLPMHRESDVPAVDLKETDTPYMSQIYPIGHIVQTASERRITVIGMVKFPGVYYLDSSWHLASLMDLCVVMKFSATQRIRFQRDSDGYDKKRYVNLKKLIDQQQVFELRDGDVYFVDYLPL